MEQPGKVAHVAFELRKSRIGVIMTIIYSIIYGGFVALNLFRPDWMSKRVLLGLNLAIAYGLGLIIIAVIFALIYNQLVRISVHPTADSPPNSPKENTDQ